MIAASPAIVNNVVYVGSWDGYEYALNATSGALLWKTFLGQTTDPVCDPALSGVTSGATESGGVVYVGGGNAYWYALSAATGAVLWDVYTGDNSQAGAHYNWSSPLIANGYAYIGIASNCDNPLVQGQLLQVSLTTHQIVNTADFVPNGQVGGGIWTSPTLDTTTNTVFVSTGTLNLYTQTLSQGVVALDATTLAVKSHWQLPFEAAVSDSDWGTTPTLTTDAKGDQLMSLANKNGVLYTFNRNNLAAGPIWSKQIAIGGDCPTCGDGSISSGTSANGTLYYAGGSNTGANGVGYGGSVTAFNPATGAELWDHETDSAVIPALAYDNGNVIDLEGNTLEVLNAATGAVIYAYNLPGGTYVAPAIAEGKLFVGSLAGQMMAFIPGTIPAAPPADPHCPTGDTCQNIGTGQLTGSESTAGTTLTITGSGNPITHGATADTFRFVSQPWSGDGQLSVEVLTQSDQGGANAQPQAGLMMRQSTLSTSPFYAITEYPNDNIEGAPQPRFDVWYRQSWGQPVVEMTKVYPATLPRYLMIQRHGDSFSTAQSTDGTHWSLIAGTTQKLVMTTSLLSGMMVDSGLNTNNGTAGFTKFSLGAITVTPTPAAPATKCPTGWTCQDVGNPGGTGNQTLAGTTWTLNGAGAGIGGLAPPTSYADAFHFVYQTLTGNGLISADVTDPKTNPAGSVAGIMMRADTTPGSPYYAVLLNPGGGGIVDWRVNNNLESRTFVNLTGQASPSYLEIQKYTDTTVTPNVTYYGALTSPDGVNWTPVLGSTAALNLGSSVLVGMAAADPVSFQTPASATFTAVTVTTGTTTAPPGICPTGWTCEDVGVGINHPGNQTYTGPTGSVPDKWTFDAGGPDIWSVYDQFRFAYQPLNGDGTMSAQVVSATNVGGPWEKAGVMIRSATNGGGDPQAPYYGVFVTPSKGIAVQWRTTEGGFTNQVLTTGTAPVFLMVARYTDTAHNQVYYTSYDSPDGKTWTQIPNSSFPLNLPGPLVTGLAADSYGADNATVVFEADALDPRRTSTDGHLPGRVELRRHRQPYPRRPTGRRRQRQLDGLERRRRHLGRVRPVPLRLPDDASRRHPERERHRPDGAGPVRQDRRHAARHHRPWISVLRGIHNPRQRGGGAMAGQPGGDHESDPGARHATRPADGRAMDRSQHVNHVLHGIHLARRKDMDTGRQLDTGHHPHRLVAGRVRHHVPRSGCGQYRQSQRRDPDQHRTPARHRVPRLLELCRYRGRPAGRHPGVGHQRRLDCLGGRRRHLGHVGSVPLPLAGDAG